MARTLPGILMHWLNVLAVNRASRASQPVVVIVVVLVVVVDVCSSYCCM